MADLNLNLSNNNQPRTIRARTGQTTDPLPPGKKLEEKEFPNITPAKHDGADAPELSKEDIKAHKEELQHQQNAAPKYDPSGESKNIGPVKSAANIKAGREPHIN
jgi:hypothetical protein